MSQTVEFEEIPPNNPEYITVNNTESAPQQPPQQQQQPVSTAPPLSSSNSPDTPTAPPSNTTQATTQAQDIWSSITQEELDSFFSSPDGTDNAASATETPLPTSIELNVTGTTPDAVAALTGVQKGINGILDLSWSAGNFVKEGITEGWHNASFRAPNEAEKKRMIRFNPVETRTVSGKIIESATQFLTGMVAGGAVLKGAKILQGADMTARAARLEAQSAIADFSAFDAHEERLGNLLDNVAGLRDSFLAYTAARPDDTEAEGRFKNMLEGIGIGKGLNAVFLGLRTMKNIFRSKSLSEAQDALRQGSMEIEEAIAAEDAGQTLDGLPARKNGEQAGSTADTLPVMQNRGQSASTPDPLPAMQNGEQAARGVPDPLPAMQHGEQTTSGAAQPPAMPWEGPSGNSRKKATVQSNEENMPGGNPDGFPISAMGMEKIIRRAATADDAVQDILYNVNLRRQLFEGPTASNTILTVAEQLVDKTVKAAGPEHHADLVKQSFDDLKALGDDMTPLISRAIGSTRALKKVQRNIMVARAGYNLMFSELTRMGKVMMNSSEGLSPMEYVRFAMLTKNVQNLHVALADLRTGSGRLLSSFKATMMEGEVSRNLNGDIQTTVQKWLDPATIADDTAAVRWLNANNITIEDIRAQAVRVMAAEGNMAAQKAALRWGTWGKFMDDILQSLYINNLLSNPVTHGVNFAGNIIKALDAPSSHLIGSFLYADKEGMRRACHEFAGLAHAFSDSFKLMGAAFRLNDNILMAGSGVMDRNITAFSGEGLEAMLRRNMQPGQELSPAMQTLVKAFDWMGKTCTLPGRLMISADEMFKQLTFRSQMYARLCDEAYTKGAKTASEAAAYAQESMGRYIDDMGRAVDNADTADALRLAKEATFSKELGEFGTKLQNLAGSNIATRMVIPFTRTPLNIIKDYLSHTPLLLGNIVYGPKEWKAMFRRDPMFRREVMGKVAMGTLTYATALGLVLNGKITGSPPADEKERKMAKAAGVRWYAAKIGDNWVEYKRFDPVGIFFSTLADAAKIQREWAYYGSYDEDDKVTSKLLAIAVNNITNKTYMQGFADFVNAVNEPERYGQSWTARQMTNFVPFSQGMRFVKNMVDPVQREMDGYLDYFKAMSPLHAETLPARVNWVTGEHNEASYFITKRKDDKVLRELTRLADGIMGEPSSRIQGIKLNKEQHAFFKEAHGTIKIGGKTMHDVLSDLFSQPAYDIRREHLEDVGLKQQGPREIAVNKVINRFREAAEHQTLLAFPELAESIREARILRYTSRKGVADRRTKPEDIQGW